MSKGSTPRPLSVPREQFGDRFDAIFKRKEQRCDCQPGQCTKGAQYCKDWEKRGRK
jgi:hypothetical protein